ncbi:error-prone DNA polymerase [Bradyrhizobium sp. Ghvi]|nr:error-prone DNA polymerase [Bradyrhizobium sp. Ghvi]
MEKVLGKTIGVPLFQEQRCGSRSSAPASRPARPIFRKSMATFKHTGGVSSFKAELVDGILDGAFQFIRVGMTAYDKRLAGQ